MGILQRLGAAALGAPFVWLGYEAAARPGGRILLAERLGVPRPEAAVRLNGMAMVAGGLGLITGVLPRAAAAGLVASLVPTTLPAMPSGEMMTPRCAHRTASTS